MKSTILIIEKVTSTVHFRQLEKFAERNWGGYNHDFQEEKNNFEIDFM